MCKVYIRNIIEFTHSFRFFRGHLLHCTRNTESASGAAIQGASLELQGQGKIPSPAVFPQRQPHSLPSPEQKVKVDNGAASGEDAMDRLKRIGLFTMTTQIAFGGIASGHIFPQHVLLK